MLPISGAKQLAIPNAHHQDSLRGQKRVPLLIMFLLFGKSVAGAVQFHGKLGFVTIEIEVVALGNPLPAKFIPGQPAGAKQPPEPPFRPSRLLP